MTYIDEFVNEYGTPISRFVCDTCGNPYTICPVVPAERMDRSQDCLAEDCDSYDPMRDADLYFGLGMVKRDA